MVGKTGAHRVLGVAGRDQRWRLDPTVVTGEETSRVDRGQGDQWSTQSHRRLQTERYQQVDQVVIDGWGSTADLEPYSESHIRH